MAHTGTASSPLLRITVIPVVPAGSATGWAWPHLATSGQWMPWCREQGVLTPAQPVPVPSSHPLSHPGSHLGPWGPRKTRQGFHWGSHITFLWGRKPARGITWVGDKGLPIYGQFLLSSYFNAFPTARPCPSSTRNTTPMDNVQDLTLCAKEILTHLQLQGCQLTPPYLPPQL